MLGRSLTFGPKSVGKCPQQGNFFLIDDPYCLGDFWPKKIAQEKIPLFAFAVS